MGHMECSTHDWWLMLPVVTDINVVEKYSEFQDGLWADVVGEYDSMKWE